MLNITRDTGEFLDVLIRATAPHRILEIGTSNGYSTIWLARAAQAVEGRVKTIELSSDKIALATVNFERAGLNSVITQVHGNAGYVLSMIEANAIDFLFLDSERTEYPAWWPNIRRIIRPGGLLVADNATSHPEQMAPLIQLVRNDTSFASCLVPVGNGEFLATRSVRIDA